MATSEFWARRIRRRRVLQGGLAGAAVLALAACGAKPRGGSSSSSTTAKGAAKPKSGGTLNYAITADPFDWDPSYAGPGIPNADGYHLAYNTLLTFKHGAGVPYDDLTLQPELVSKWEVPDAQTFIFHLRNGVKFADLPPVNGRAFDANDVKFSLEYASRTGAVAAKNLPAAQYATFFEGISGVQVVDPATVKVTFGSPFVPFINYMASPFIPMLAHEIYDQDGNFQNQIVGTGPFQLDKASSQHGSKWVWKKNTMYWDAGKPYMDGINWLVVQDDAAAQAAFQTKQLDLLDSDLDQTSMDVLTKAMPSAVKYQTVDPAPMHLYMSVKPSSPLADLRLRQAIAYTIDRDAFLKTLFNGQGAWPMAGAFPDTYSQAEIRSMLKHDLTQAKQLVAAAGHPDGVDLQFNYPGNAYGQIYITQMQLLQSQLKQVGINLQLNSLDKATESTLKKEHKFTITDTTKSLAGDVDSYLYAVFYPGSRENYTDVNDPQLTPLLVQQRQETDPTKRRQIVREAVKRINVDEVWALGVYNGLIWNIWQPRLHDYAPHFALTLTLDSAWLSE